MNVHEIIILKYLEGSKEVADNFFFFNDLTSSRNWCSEVILTRLSRKKKSLGNYNPNWLQKDSLFKRRINCTILAYKAWYCTVMKDGQWRLGWNKKMRMLQQTCHVWAPEQQSTNELRRKNLDINGVRYSMCIWWKTKTVFGENVPRASIKRNLQRENNIEALEGNGSIWFQDTKLNKVDDQWPKQIKGHCSREDPFK